MNCTIYFGLNIRITTLLTSSKYLQTTPNNYIDSPFIWSFSMFLWSNNEGKCMLKLQKQYSCQSLTHHDHRFRMVMIVMINPCLGPLTLHHSRGIQFSKTWRPWNWYSWMRCHTSESSSKHVDRRWKTWCIEKTTPTQL